MKTKLLLSLSLICATLFFSQSKVNPPKENLKFYFPAKSIENSKDYEKNLNNLVSQIATIEINEKAQRFSRDAEAVYLMQKNYKGLLTYSNNEKFPKTSLPLKNYAEAMIADPSKGEKFKKTFTDNFSKDFIKMDEPIKTAIANQYFEEKMAIEDGKMAADFKDQLSKNKTDSITYKEAKKLINFEVYNDIGKTILPLGKTAVKGYVLEYLQPYITGNLWMSVVKPKEVDDLPDTSKEYKLLFELVNFSSKENKETAFKNENTTLLEAGRVMNLHIASGIPAEKLKIVVLVHGGAIDMMLNNDRYKDSYKVDNPNLALIKQMQNKGVKFVVCGQLMTWSGLKLSDLTENVKEAYSAKTALSNYQTQGYVLYKIQADE